MKERISKRIVLLSMVAIMMMLLVGCSLFYNEYDFVRYKAPNWTDDGKIVFVKDYRHVRDKKTITGLIGDVSGSWETYILCEMERDGSNYTEICTLAVCKESAYLLRIDNTSSSGEWVTIGMRGGYGMKKGVYVVKRDGSGLQKVGEGTYPDFSPNADKIVYQKENEGIWIMNRDGSDDHQIVSDTTASYPAWSPDDTLIAYISFYSPYSTIVTTNNGTKTDSFTKTYFYDWGGAGTNLIYCGLWSGKDVSINLNTGEIDSTNIIQNIYRCSRNGEYFICEDSNYYVIKKDGTNKHYIEP